MQFYEKLGAVSLLLICLSPRSPAQAPAAQPGAQITLDEAIRRAQANEPNYAAAVADSRVAGADRSIAVAGLLPSVRLYGQGLYTQPNGLKNQAGQGAGAQPSPRFIANNAVREYASQGMVDEALGMAQAAEVRRADAAAAMAAAEMEVARRGLVVTVTELFYGVVAADNKLTIATEAHGEAADFLHQT